MKRLALKLALFTALVSNAFSQTWAVQDSGRDLPYLGVDFVDRNNGWVVGYDGTIVHTTNGGTTWAQQTTGVNFPIQGLDFVDANDGWGTAGLRVLRTTNGGATWTNQSVNMSALGVTFVNLNDGWIVGMQDDIQHTTDGGGTWSQQASGTTGAFRAASFADANNGWVVGDDDPNGTVLHTTNGGVTWTVQSHPPIASAWSVACTDANTCWVPGDHGRIIHTENGGSTWTVEDSLSAFWLTDITFVDADHGWAVGNAGAILHYVGAQDAGKGFGPAIPTSIFLSQNYPNPFNPSTTLTFGVPRMSQVSLDIFDILGRKTATLFSGVTQPGVHEVLWNCPTCPSGVYFVRMRAGGQTLEKEMLLVK